MATAAKKKNVPRWLLGSNRCSLLPIVIVSIVALLSPLFVRPLIQDRVLDGLNHSTEGIEVLDGVDRDELTGDLVGQEAALLDVTASRGIDDLSTIGHGQDRLNGLLLDAAILYDILCVVVLLQYSSSLLALLEPSIVTGFSVHAG